MTKIIGGALTSSGGGGGFNSQEFIPAEGEVRFIVTKFNLNKYAVFQGGANQTEFCSNIGNEITFEDAKEGLTLTVIDLGNL